MKSFAVPRLEVRQQEDRHPRRAAGKRFWRADCSTPTMRLVVKVGTSLIAPGGRIDTNRMRALVDQLDLSHHEYLIVSSG
ncbi:MAG TPA: hypothetical protein VKB77_10335, partial [Terriglobales bacterium]|nr:hypothetical protein [Terriglobales bacterium]